jgi:hypothetical protein
VRRLPLVCCVALLLLSTTACNAFGDDVAATVEGHDISVDAVTTLARDPSFNQGQSAGTKSVLAGDVGRSALTQLIQYQLIANELSRRGASVTTQDQDAIDQQYGDQLRALKPAVAAIVRKGLVDANALDRVLRSIDVNSKAEREALYARTPSFRNVRCAEMIVAPGQGQTAIEDALDKGASFAQVVAQGTGGAQVLPSFGSGQQCVSRDAKPNFPASVLHLLFDTKPDTIGSTVLQSSQSDVLVVVHAIADRTLGPDDAVNVAAVAQGGLARWLPLVVPDARVTVNPQYGRGFALAGVIPPMTPALPGSAGAAATAPAA